MADDGDPLRDAFRDQLATIVGDPPAGVFAGFVIKDTINTTDKADAATNFITLRFGAASEQPYSFGSPGSNMWKETGEVFADIFPTLGSGHAAAEKIALAIRNAFRALATGSSFATTTGQTIKVTAVTPSLGGPVDGAWWVETIAVAYRVFNVG